MKILFVLENLTERCGANVNIALNLAKCLREKHEVFALARYDDVSPIDGEKAGIFHEVSGFHADEGGALTDFVTRRFHWSGLSALKKIWLLLTHPKILYYMLDVKYRNWRSTEKKYKKNLRAFCKEKQPDAIIGVSAPYYIAKAVASTKVKATKTVLQLDPYTYNYTLSVKGRGRRAKTEQRVIECLDRLFAVSFVSDEIRQKGISTQTDKIVPFHLPCLLANAPVEPPPDVQAESGETVRFVFVGQFYEKIRNPRFLLELFCRLPKAYELHLVGGGAESTVAEYQEKLGQRLVRHGWVSSDRAKQMMQNADFLINLNNSIENQLASKLIEYIYTGKPFLNICKRTDCLSLPYTRRYDNCINVFEPNGIEDGVLGQLVSFVDTHRGTLVDRKEILRMYRENTDVFVCDLIEEQLLQTQKS